MPDSDDHPEHPEIEATALIAASPEVVFDFLSDLANHWRLVDRFVEVIELSGQKSLPVLELADGEVYRAESDDMAERVRSGKLESGPST